MVIDEVQKVPKILNTVHKEIEKKRFHFLLTGSSARKLKRGGANLLAGRAFERHMHSLTSFELGEGFDIKRALQIGTLPKTTELSDEACKEYLQSYVNTYLREEVQVEQLLRKMDPFRMFLEVAGQTSGNIVNYSKIARNIGSDPTSVKNYFQILEDTLLGFYMYPFNSSVRKRLAKTPKFYFFDVGVIRAIERKLHLAIEPGTYDFGRFFEHFVIQEIYRLNQYTQSQYALMYFKTKDQREIDVILERPGEPVRLIEIKSTDRVSEDHTRSLPAVCRDLSNSKALLLSREQTAKKVGLVSCMHWQEGLAELFPDI